MVAEPVVMTRMLYCVCVPCTVVLLVLTHMSNVNDKIFTCEREINTIFF